MADKTSKQWMEFLRPVMLGLCALMSAAAMYLQRTDSTNMDSRMTAVEVEVKNIQPWRAEVTNDMKNFRVVLSDIRSDVSFIRGKMETAK